MFDPQSRNDHNKQQEVENKQSARAYRKNNNNSQKQILESNDILLVYWVHDSLNKYWEMAFSGVDQVSWGRIPMHIGGYQAGDFPELPTQLRDLNSKESTENCGIHFVQADATQTTSCMWA